MSEKKYLYQEIADDIKNRIKNGEFENGMKLGTESSLCNYYGVSRSTIRKALKELESANYVKRLLGKGTYINSNMKTQEQTNSTKQTIMVIVPVLSRDFISDIVTGIHNIISKSNYSADLNITNNSIEKEKESVNNAIKNNVSGVIIHPTNNRFYNEEILKLKNNNIPFIMTARYYEFLDCNYVVPDNYEGGYKITKHLLENGHKNIGLISDKPLIQTSIRDRIKGYEECLSDNGICLNKNNIMNDLKDPCRLYSAVNREKEYDEKFNKIQTFIEERNSSLTAIFAVNDFLARETVAAAQELDLKVPQDLSIFGFDNVFLAQKTAPSLTTLNWSQTKVGKYAAENLLKIIKGNKEKVRKVLPVEVVERNSVKNISKLKATS